MATGTYAPDPFFTGFDANGDPLAAGKLYTYLAGTTTLQATYTDVDLAPGHANANPIILDSAGRATIFLTPGSSYKFVLQDSTGAAVATRDNVSAVPASSINLDVTGTAGEALTAGQAVYLSDGSGSKTAGQWFKADSGQAYSSILPEVGMVPSSIASAASGTIRQGGSMTGLSTVVGTTYYIGASGAITATAPTNNRRVLGVADTTSSLILREPAVPPVDVETCQGRLTLTTATPVTTADVTAATTLYWTPYKGNRVAIYDGTAWSLRVFTELSIAIPATTSQMYDVWVYDNAGTLALELLAWTSDTARATALTTQDGVYVKTGVTTRRFLGSVRTTTVSGQTEDSIAKRYVSNYYNRVERLLRVLETSNSWAYSTPTWRQARATATNQLDVVVCVAELLLNANVVSTGTNATLNINSYVAIAEDGSTAPVAGCLMQLGTAAAGVNMAMGAQLRKYPAVGRHFYPWMEYAASGTMTWWGTAGATEIQSGIHGSIQG